LSSSPLDGPKGSNIGDFGNDGNIGNFIIHK
jgi:hypothetical protein